MSPEAQETKARGKSGLTEGFFTEGKEGNKEVSHQDAKTPRERPEIFNQHRTTLRILRFLLLKPHLCVFASPREKLSFQLK
jgi:hypothetical protein